MFTFDAMSSHSGGRHGTTTHGNSAEDIRSKFDLVLEGHAALHTKIDEFRRESNEKHELTALQISALKERIDTVEQKLTARIDTFEQNLTAHIQAVAADLSAHRADTEAHPGYFVRE